MTKIEPGAFTAWRDHDHSRGHSDAPLPWQSWHEWLSELPARRRVHLCHGACTQARLSMCGEGDFRPLGDAIARAPTLDNARGSASCSDPYATPGPLHTPDSGDQREPPLAWEAADRHSWQTPDDLVGVAMPRWDVQYATTSHPPHGECDRPLRDPLGRWRAVSLDPLLTAEEKNGTGRDAADHELLVGCYPAQLPSGDDCPWLALRPLHRLAILLNWGNDWPDAPPQRHAPRFTTLQRRLLGQMLGYDEDGELMQWVDCDYRQRQALDEMGPLPDATEAAGSCPLVSSRAPEDMRHEEEEAEEAETETGAAAAAAEGEASLGWTRLMSREAADTERWGRHAYADAEDAAEADAELAAARAAWCEVHTCGRHICGCDPRHNRSRHRQRDVLCAACREESGREVPLAFCREHGTEPWSQWAVIDDDSQPLQLTDADRRRIRHDMRRYQAHTKQEQEARHDQVRQRLAEEAHELRPCHPAFPVPHYDLPYDWVAAIEWERHPERPRDETLVGQAEAERRASGKAGRPLARPRTTPYQGCVFLYPHPWPGPHWRTESQQWGAEWVNGDPTTVEQTQTTVERDWQAAEFYQRFPWGIPRALIPAWREWVATRVQTLTTQGGWRQRKWLQQVQQQVPYRIAEWAAVTRGQAAAREAVQEAQRDLTKWMPPVLGGMTREQVRDGLNACLDQLAWVRPTTVPLPGEVLPAETGLWVSTKEAARILGLHTDAVRRWRKRREKAGIPLPCDGDGMRGTAIRLDAVLQYCSDPHRLAHDPRRTRRDRSQSQSAPPPQAA